jgi:hypothetical protein
MPKTGKSERGNLMPKRGDIEDTLCPVDRSASGAMYFDRPVPTVRPWVQRECAHAIGL